MKSLSSIVPLLIIAAVLAAACNSTPPPTPPIGSGSQATTTATSSAGSTQSNSAALDKLFASTNDSIYDTLDWQTFSILSGDHAPYSFKYPAAWLRADPPKLSLTLTVRKQLKSSGSCAYAITNTVMIQYQPTNPGLGLIQIHSVS